jgi:hypothetical protein
MADTARALNEQARCNFERPASLVELLRLLWRAVVCHTALAGVEMKKSPQKRSQADGSDDVVASKLLSGLDNLLATPVR